MDDASFVLLLILVTILTVVVVVALIVFIKLALAMRRLTEKADALVSVSKENMEIIKDRFLKDVGFFSLLRLMFKKKR